MMDARPYSIETLRDLLINHSHGRNRAVGRKPHIAYLDQYLTKLVCKTIVVEPHYIDRNFLEDYAAYYVRCFEAYSRVCARLHFFDEELTPAQIDAAITAPDATRLQTAYLGFLVIKPLPLTVIGRTCLRTYGAMGGRERVFPTLQNQAANFFGLKLNVSTLPFQEQDKEVAACASSALWSVLHSTARLFQHAILSPVEITKAASAHSRLDERTLPNGSGLNTLQIADAIRSVGLEPLGVGVTALKVNKDGPPEYRELLDDVGAAEDDGSKNADAMQIELKLAVMAYLRSGMACLLLSRVSQIEDGQLKLRGHHAVALTGYCLSKGEAPLPYSKSATLFTASRMDRLYAHDDQIGPFAGFDFKNGNILSAGPDADLLNEKSTIAQPINIVVPLYHKIRIPLREIVNLTVVLDGFIEEVRTLLRLSERLEWDIQLNDLGATRATIAASGLANAAKLALLTKPLPRFVWRVTAYHRAKPVLDILFDATDLLQGNLLREIVAHDGPLCERIGLVFSAMKALVPSTLTGICEAFITLQKSSEKAQKPAAKN